MRVIATIEDCEVTLQDDGSVTWTAPAMIDGDGSGGNPYQDPDFQPDTSLHHHGKPLDAEAERYIVVPLPIIDDVAGIVLGCQAHVFNATTGLETEAVVGDRGPTRKLGEMSIACAQALGIPSSPTRGGESRPVISYRILPGVPAQVAGEAYTLQPFS